MIFRGFNGRTRGFQGGFGVFQGITDALQMFEGSSWAIWDFRRFQGFYRNDLAKFRSVPMVSGLFQGVVAVFQQFPRDSGMFQRFPGAFQGFLRHLKVFLEFLQFYVVSRVFRRIKGCYMMI